MKSRKDVLLAVAIGGCAVSGACLYYFAWGMFYMQDLWDVSRYVLYLVGGLVAAIAAMVAGETLRRSHKALASGLLGGTAIGLARLLLVIQVGVFLYCNAGPVRTVAAAIVRRAATYGMARDLPLPTPSA